MTVSPFRFRKPHFSTPSRSTANGIRLRSGISEQEWKRIKAGRVRSRHAKDRFMFPLEWIIEKSLFNIYKKKDVCQFFFNLRIPDRRYQVFISSLKFKL